MRTSAPMRMPPFWQAFDAVEPRQTRDIDETVRTGDSTLHQIEQIRAGREIGGTRFGGGRDSVGDGRGPNIIEGVHAACLRSVSARILCASNTASVIPE